LKAFYLKDQTARRVGYCFREGDMIKIEKPDRLVNEKGEHVDTVMS